MASVTYDDGFLHQAAALEQYLQLDTQLAEAGSGPQQVRMYAGGNTRMVTGPGVARVLDLTFDLCTRDTYETLAEWAGDLLLFRARGIVLYGGYDGKGYQIQHYPATDIAVVTVRFAGVSPSTVTAA